MSLSVGLNLSEREKGVLIDILSDLKSKGTEIEKPIELRKPVPIEEWLEDPYYVGASGKHLYPFWKKQMIKIFKKHEPGEEVNEVILDGAIGCRPWLSSRVQTSRGWLTCEELEKIDYEVNPIYVMTEDGPQRIIDVLKKSGKPVTTVKLQFDDRSEYEVTDNHRLRTIRGKSIQWIYAKDIQIGDKILKSRQESIYPKHNLDIKEAYAWGFFIGDGNDYKETDKANRNRTRWNIGSTTLNTRAEKDIYEYMSLYGNVNVWNGVNKNDSEYRQLNSSSKELKFKAVQCGHGAQNKHIPEFVYKYSKHDMCEFIAGLWDSDGSVEGQGNRVQLAYACTSERLIREIQQILFNLGIVSRINKEHSKSRKLPLYRLRITDSLSVWKFNQLIDLRVPYKKDKLSTCRITISSNITDLRDVLVEECLPRGLKSKYNLQNSGAGIIKLNEVMSNEDIENEFLEYLYRNQCYEVEVVSKEFSEEICGDISVDTNHTYLCDGFINHNTGKSTVALFCMIRKLYEISCYENIAGLFNLMPDTTIAFIYFSLSRETAERTGFGELRNYIDTIPYFNDYFLRNKNKNSELLFPENVLIYSGSSQLHSTGVNMLGCILDEANFRSQKAQIKNLANSVDTGKVSAMYSSILQRGASRFLFKGYNHSLCILVSSSTVSNSFTEQRKKAALTDKHCLIVNARLWDVKPKGTYSDEGFWVFVGSELLEPCIVETVADIYAFTDTLGLPRGDVDPSEYEEEIIQDIIEGLSDVYRSSFTWVPKDFKKKYQDDIYMALQDISGISVAPTGRLFNSKPAYRRALTKMLTHPFTKESIILSTGDNLNLMDYLRKDYFPIMRDKTRYFHFDQSLTRDWTGAASVFLDHFEEDPSTHVLMPHYMVDVMLSAKPPKLPSKISISKCSQLVYLWRDYFKIPVGKVTYDSYASAGIIQTLQSDGFIAETLSVDRTSEQYIYMINCFLNGQIKIYQHDRFEFELFDLILDRVHNKVDHSPVFYSVEDNENKTQGGHKDITDGVAGALWNCYQATLPLMERNSTLQSSQDLMQGAIPYKNEFNIYSNKGSDYNSLIDNMLDSYDF